MEADIQYDEEGDSIYTGGQDQEQCAGKRRQCPDCQNGNSGFDGPVSISCRGVAEKKHPNQHSRRKIAVAVTVSCPAY